MYFQTKYAITKATPSYIFVSHKNAGRFWAKFSEKKHEISIFWPPLIGCSGEIITSFPQKIIVPGPGGFSVELYSSFFFHGLVFFPGCLVGFTRSTLRKTKI